MWVICLNALKESTVKFGTDLDEDSDSDNDCDLEQCKLCLFGDIAKKHTDLHGTERMFHNIGFQDFQVKDKKAQCLCQPVKNSICATCLEEMRSGSWMQKHAHRDTETVQPEIAAATTKGKGKKRASPKPTSVSNLKKHKINVAIDDPAYFLQLHNLFVSKDASFRKYIKQYAATLNNGFGIEYHHVDIKDFQKSPYWAMYVAEAGDLFTGYFCDPHTPVNHHFTDTLHLLITTMNVAAHLLIIAAQRIETVVEGLGIHALCHGLTMSGFEILAKNILDNASLKYGDRMKTFVSAVGGKVTETMSFDKATALEFQKFVKQKATAERMGELFKQLCVPPKSSVLEASMLLSKFNTKTKQIEKVLEALDNLPDQQVVELLTHEEHQFIDRNLFLRKVNTFEFAKESPLDIEGLIEGSKIQLQGRESRRMLNGGFASVLSHMNLFAVTAQLQNREKMDMLKKKIAKLHRKTEEADNAVKELLSKLSDCCDEAEMGKMDLDGSTIENMCSDMAASMEAVERHEVDISAYQADILATSHDMLLLYSGSSEIEVDPILLKLQNIFDCLKAVLHPLVERTSDNVDGMIDALNNQEANITALSSAIRDADLNLKFGDKSEYFHHICTMQHAERECRYLLENYGIHLSEINCELSEHANKVFKGLLVRLQGFANRCIAKYSDGNGGDSNSVLNHFGFVIQEHMLKFYHHFDTLLPRKGTTHCGICDGVNHNARGCKLACRECGKGYYVGHSRLKCESQRQPA